MTRRALIAGIVMILFSCAGKSDQNDNSQGFKDDNGDGLHDNLISFESEMLYDMDEYFSLDTASLRSIGSKDFSDPLDTLEYRDDTIYASYMIYLNSCGHYEGNIDYNGDTLILIENDKSKHKCGSGRVDRFRFWIHNPERKEFIPKRKYVSAWPIQ